MRVLITGGTGLIGGYLQKALLSQNAEVVVLTRSPKTATTKGLSYSIWDLKNKVIDKDIVCSVDHIIHLAGAGIADKKWTEEQKKKIIDSRVQTASLIFETLKNNPHKVKTIVSASGADCYGLQTTNKTYKEQDDFGTDFLAEVCKQWEQSIYQFHVLGIRTVCLRTGVVFAKQDSALQKMSLPIRLGIGSAIGTGQQIMSYIHIKDLCNMYIKALLDVNISGSYNAISGNCTNAALTKSIAKVLKRPLFFPKVPAFVMKLIFGEMSSILLEGSAVDNTKIKEAGFKFKYTDLETLLKDVFVG